MVVGGGGAIVAPGQGVGGQLPHHQSDGGGQAEAARQQDQLEDGHCGGGQAFGTGVYWRRISWSPQTRNMAECLGTKQST